MNLPSTSLPARALLVVSLTALLLSGLTPGAVAAPVPAATIAEQTPPATAPPAAEPPAPAAESPEAVPEPSTSGSLPPALPAPEEPVAPAEGTTPAVPDVQGPPAATEAPTAGTGIAAAGPSTPIGGIAVKWKALGGAAGVLGGPTSDESCDAAGHCVQTFVGGEIHYAPATGGHAVLLTSGRIGPQWAATGSLAAFGYPVTDEQCTANGCFQRFSGGIDLTWSTTAGHHQVSTRGAIGRALHRSYGGYATAGYPTSAEVCDPAAGGCSQQFGGLRILWSASTGAFGVRSPGAIATVYSKTGAERGPLGYPTSPEICGLRSAGCKQSFQRGVIAWSRATGAHISRGGMLSAWAARGAQDGALGYPLGNEVCGQPNGGCIQKYQGGTAFWSRATGVHSTNGSIGSRHGSLGAHRGPLGYPRGAEVCGQRDRGCYQQFQGGTILWSPATGSHPVRGGIRSRYDALGASRSYLGYPVAQERCENSSCVQSFQGGYISWSASGTRDHRHTECTSLNNGRSRYPTGGARRVLLTIAGAYGQSSARAVYCQKVAGSYVTDWQTDATVGASGFRRPGVPSGPTRFSYSPTGSYSVTEAFGLGNPGTALPYRTLNPRSRWGGNPYTSTYNKYFESSGWEGYDENMWYFATRATHDYRQGAVINYNRPPDSPIVQDAGFAIFLHQNKVATAGCIALDDWAVVDYLRKSTPGDRIIMGVASDLFR